MQKKANPCYKIVIEGKTQMRIAGMEAKVGIQN
jgi:hypothetical protein